MSAGTLLTLETNGIILSCLSGLWGVYLVLFVIAIWSTHQQGTATSKRLRWVTIALFLDLLLHFITRSLQFTRARLQIDTDTEARMWEIPLVLIGNVTGTISGLLSDGTLAWRFYIIFDREWWALYLPAIWVIMNACLRWSVDFQALAYYERPELYLNNLLPVTLKISMAWGWSMFCSNSFMTGGIMGKILWTKNAADSLREGRRTLNRYAIALRVIIESALVTWVGILLLEIGMLGPSKGHVVENQNIGYIMLSVLPSFYGISQTLITARLGLVKETCTDPTDDAMSSQDQPGLGQPRFGQRPPTFNIYTSVTTTTRTDYQGGTEVLEVIEEEKKAEKV